MENTGTKWYVVFGVFMLVLLFGAGGYYLGRYMDTTANEEAKKKLVSSSTVTFYENKDLGISFSYPKTWTLKATSGEENSDTTSDSELVTVTSPNGSVFEYHKYTSTASPLNLICDKDNPNGVEDVSEKCTFFESGSKNYARFVSFSDEEFPDVWSIAEIGTDTNDDYKYIPTNGFLFKVKVASDLTALDGIMKTVNRL